MISTESIASAHKRATFNSEQNEYLLAANFDLIEERRDTTRLKVVIYHQRLTRYYNRKVKPRHFKKGDHVLRLLLPGARNPQEGALCPNWKGFYVVDEDLSNKEYHLLNVNGAQVLGA
ncbi:hypothetical protein ACOSQ3_016970 [Xanthoceras sorbifolium]